MSIEYYFEKFYPSGIAAISAVLFHIYGNDLPKISELTNNLIGGTLMVSATLLGFLLTITTILSAISTRRMRFVKEAGKYPEFVKFQTVAIWLNVVCVSISIIYPFILAVTTDSGVILYIRTCSVFIAVWSWLASVRFTHIFLNILHDPN